MEWNGEESFDLSSRFPAAALVTLLLLLILSYTYFYKAIVVVNPIMMTITKTAAALPCRVHYFRFKSLLNLIHDSSAETMEVSVRSDTCCEQEDAAIKFSCQSIHYNS